MSLAPYILGDYAQVMNGGAKPPVGTPPFSPPYPNTGGAEPANAQRKGLAGFIDRVFNPTNALGQFGQALVASGNSPVSRAMALMMQQGMRKRQGMEQSEQAQLQRQVERDDWLWKEQWKRDNQGPDQTSFQKDLAAAGIDPNSDEGRKLYRQWVTSRADPIMQIQSTVDGVPGYQIAPRSMFLSGEEPSLEDAPAAQPAVGGVAKVGALAPRTDQVHSALLQQESGDTPGRPGPMTRYGQPMGAGQMLEGTAREMAAKLGLAWSPDLYRGTSAEAGDYQRKLSRAYLDEGLERTGNERDALRYYHGGPDRKLWGPKTNAYAESVLGRAVPSISSKAQFDALPSGTRFRAPDGSVRVKP